MKHKMFPDEVCQGLNTINMEMLRQLPWQQCSSCLWLQAFAFDLEGWGLAVACQWQLSWSGGAGEGWWSEQCPTPPPWPPPLLPGAVQPCALPSAWAAGGLSWGILPKSSCLSALPGLGSPPPRQPTAFAPSLPGGSGSQ